MSLLWHFTCHFSVLHNEVIWNRTEEGSKSIKTREKSSGRSGVTAKQNGPAPWWWFEGGTETCSVCSHSYAYQTGGYCLDCDGTVCSVCVQETVTMELLCPGCVTTRESEGESI